ncbi:MAG: hypothetical protein HY351_03870 [Candidatus Omnitrophica bacterium]|nr:hypothetical protein [Candidatus Omnitrophota bacterium]
MFFTIATTITGGTFYLYLHPNQKDLTVDHFGFVGSGMLIAIGLGSVLVVSNNLRSWREHRKEIRKLNPNAPPLRSPQWWLNEILGCVGITLFVGVYLRFNPLYHIPSCCGIAVSFLTFIVGILPLLLCDDSRTE